MTIRLKKALITSLTFVAALVPLTIGIAYDRAFARLSDPDFAADIAPIFRARCSPCHTGDQAAGGLSLASYDSMVKGGISGPAIKHGSSQESLIVGRILGAGGLPRMPMGFKPLADRDIELVSAWINQGAKLGTNSKARLHWAFVNPVKTAVPKYARNAIDAFVRARLKRERLPFNPPADRFTLIRRVTLDLIGLPPTISEVESFLADQSPRAYEKVVDRLLANPHYGERMALPWLDAARYADSNGFQQDGDTFQYVWRDWVVNALNENMPYDEFTIEQLAGDLLPNPTLDQLVATAFNRNHMLNGEGGAIPEEQRNVNLFDRVDTTSSTWLGLTMACARCHDHKYDPLTQRDYYSMMAYFNRVPETGVPAGSGQYRIAEPWVYAGTTAEMSSLRQAESELSNAKQAEAKYLRSPAFAVGFEQWKSRALSEIEKAKVEAAQLSNWFAVGTFVGSSFEDAFEREFGPEKGRTSASIERRDVTDGRVNVLTGDNTAFYFRRTIRLRQAMTYLLSLGSDDGIKVWLNGKEIFSRKITRAAVADSDRVTVQLQSGENELILKIVNGGGNGGIYFRAFPGGVDDEVAALLKNSSQKDFEKLTAAYATGGNDSEIAKLRVRTVDAEAKLAKAREGLPRVMVMSDAMKRETHVLHRGNYEEPIEKVEPATPQAFPKISNSKNRLGLAKWIVSPNNPLTARVQINRAWQLFFGRGLVRTEENFGMKGEPPTHPELLDWLAVDLRENGWNIKRLHKQIVMSETYRQSSKVTAKLLKQDPANIFLARAPRFRLPAMILRDVALAASGLLDPKLGGKPVYPYQPKGIWDGLSITLERDFTYPQSKGIDNYRRSLYTFWRRTAAPGNMFDSSSRQVCTVRQTLTSSPLHALTMMNDVTWVEAGAAMASSLLRFPTDVMRLTQGFFRICSRKPDSDELSILMRSLERSKKYYLANPDAASMLLSQGEFQPGKKTPELAALAAVCTEMFNLDEAMTRE